MHALVLAAGVGSRLRPYTDDLPKPMLDVGGQPIIAYNLAMLAAGGFRDVVINLHYLPNAVRAYVGDGKRWGLRVTYSEEPQLLGTAGALSPVIDNFSRGTFAVVFGDNVNDLDMSDMLGVHQESGALATVAVSYREDVSQSGVAEIGPSGQILRFIEKPRTEMSSHWVNAGVVIAEPAIFAFIDPDGPSDLGRDVFPKLIERTGGLCAYRMAGSHWWFDRIEDYRTAVADEQLTALARRLTAGPPKA
jgi:NDP-sugar pyrophosphorylase family protein